MDQMTRINVGVPPSELCNEHLMAEYRELPRCLRSFKRRAPLFFKLGTGHMAWCAQYQGSLKLRHRDLVAELRYRGYNLTDYPTLRIVETDRFWSQDDEAQARRTLIHRLTERMNQMKHVHYTNRARPDWWAT